MPYKRATIRSRVILSVFLTLIVLGVGSAMFSRCSFRAAASVKALKQVQAERRIIDVHEHIQSIDQAPTMLAVMDQLGMGKVCLMGSSLFTLTLNPKVGFTHCDENNEQLMQICEKYPGRFEAWPTMDPLDPKKLEKFDALVKRGAKGLKLYLGHGYTIKKTNQYMFHTMAIDDPRMFPVYKYLQENFIPVVLHVNPSPKTPGFADEFLAVLKQFPDMKVVCPHWMLSSIKDSRLEELLDTFPNLYTDVSFGHDDFLVPGLKRISKSPTKFRNLVNRYKTRIMFSTDLVITEEPIKDQKWIHDRFKAYLDMLTEDSYTTPVIPNERLRGLALAGDVLDRILYQNHEEFMALRPSGTKIAREINWSMMGASPVKRKPGEALPPPVL